MDEREPAESSILSGKERNTMSKPIKVRDLSCLLYNVKFRNLAEEHKPGVGDDLSGKRTLFLPTHRIKYEEI